MQGLYRIANDRINGLRNDLTTTRNQCLRSAQLLTLPHYYMLKSVAEHFEDIDF